MKIFKTIWPFILLVALLYGLGNSFGSIPPLGKLFSPFTGFWQNISHSTTSSTESENNLTTENLTISGLKAPVIIKFDENRIPHIFAENDHDLYLAQGYTIASDRLWQMEFYTLVASGRLTEVVGERALTYDQYNRRSGMNKAAEEVIERLAEVPEMQEALEAYAAGVNAYISTLAAKDYPIEYKILNYQPEPWSPKKTMLMMMNMRNQLNGRSVDFRMSQVAKKYGKEVVDDLFPSYPDMLNPVIPIGTELDFEALAIPDVPESIMAYTEDPSLTLLEKPNPNIGSNNWAVAGSKSATGLPILANDPHLGLSFPSIWYQIQLHSPNVNVYGSTLPGMPGVTIGFNKDIAWGVTNTGPDVMDFYKIKFKDESKNEYWHDGTWKETTKRAETYTIKGGDTVIDTLISTHHGPVLYLENSESNFKKDIAAGFAMKWITHDSSPTDIMCFHALNRAKNYEDYRKALTYYVAPAQNFVFASNQNDIAITPNGKLPLKWKEQGKFLLDGTLASHDWQGYIPAAHNPHVKNPGRGFVSSANQSLVDNTYPYYIDWIYADPYRGTQINNRLAAMENATIDSLRSIQNDNTNLAAKWFLPPLIPILEESSETDKAAVQLLSSWNMRNDAHEKGATVFETWINILMQNIWGDEFPENENLLIPSENKTLSMIREEPDSKWFDNIKTKNKVETMEDIVVLSFIQTIDSLNRTYGPISEKWHWDKVNNTGVRHLIPAFEAFSKEQLPIGGGKRIVNASSGKWGPSWRMVVQLDKEWPTAYGVYPGGQSGNPGSKHYDDLLDSWVAGDLKELLFFKDKAEASAKIQSLQTLNPKK